MLLYILYSKSFDILLHQPRHERPQVTMFQSILKARTAITAYCASKAGNALPSRQPQFWNRKIIETRKSLGRNDCSRNRRRRQNYYTQTELLKLRNFQNLSKKILQTQTFIYISLLLQIFDLFVSKCRSSHIKIKYAGFIFISDNS